MIDDSEVALRKLLKKVIQDVANEILYDRLHRSRFNSSHPDLSDDHFLLSSREAAQRLAISEGHLRNLTRTGVLPCVRVGQCVRYSVETIREWIRRTESTEPSHLKRVSPTTSRPASATSTKRKRKPGPKVTAKRRPAKQSNAVVRKEPAKKPEPPKRTVLKKPDSEERISPFSNLLDELGVDRNLFPSITNGEIRRIADVDIPTLHGWSYLNRELPEAALQRLKDHFSAFRSDRNRQQDGE